MRVLFILFLSSVAFGQGIPNDWLGSYEGTMEIYNQKGLQQTIGVNFDLLIMDRPNYWTYNMSYINLKNDEIVSTKAYKIFYVEDGQKLWIDEGGGLLIEMSFLGNCFYDHFELNGMFYNSSLCKKTKTYSSKLMAVNAPRLIPAHSLKKLKIRFKQCVLIFYSAYCSNQNNEIYQNHFIS
jgi:hypothetical protein